MPASGWPALAAAAAPRVAGGVGHDGPGHGLPEPGFALALYYAVSDDNAAGKRAVDWALGKADDLRQLALGCDWCQPISSPQQSAALAAKIRQLAQKRTGDSVAARRDRVLALIATADDPKHPEEAPLRDLVRQWWRAGFSQELADGRSVPPLPDLYALLELLHAYRDNLKIDLRDNAVDYFAHLPTYSSRPITRRLIGRPKMNFASRSIRAMPSPT